jgi:hypothetical protein
MKKAEAAEAAAMKKKAAAAAAAALPRVPVTPAQASSNTPFTVTRSELSGCLTLPDQGTGFAGLSSPAAREAVLSNPLTGSKRSFSVVFTVPAPPPPRPKQQQQQAEGAEGKGEEEEEVAAGEEEEEEEPSSEPPRQKRKGDTAGKIITFDAIEIAMSKAIPEGSNLERITKKQVYVRMADLLGFAGDAALKAALKAQDLKKEFDSCGGARIECLRQQELNYHSQEEDGEDTSVVVCPVCTLEQDAHLEACELCQTSLRQPLAEQAKPANPRPTAMYPQASARERSTLSLLDDDDGDDDDDDIVLPARGQRPVPVAGPSEVIDLTED